MSQNQGSRQKNARIKAGITGGQRNGDMIRMMDLVTAVTSSDYNGKWIQFVNAKFGTNINNVTGAKYYLANQIGFENFDAITQFDSLFYDGTSGNTNPNDSGASAISVQLVPSTNIELATKGDASGKLKIKGKSTGEAFIMLDVGDPVVGQEYIFRYDADWSRLRNQGKDVFVGIGLRSTTDNLHWAGLEGDHVGDTGVTYSRIYGSNLFSKGTAPTIVTGTAASEATREGSNWIKYIALSGNTYSFYVGSSTTSAGSRDANDISWTLYGVSGATSTGYSGTVQNFGFGLYTPFSDRGNFTVNITRYVFATAASGGGQASAVSGEWTQITSADYSAGGTIELSGLDFSAYDVVKVRLINVTVSTAVTLALMPNFATGGVPTNIQNAGFFASFSAAAEGYASGASRSLIPDESDLVRMAASATSENYIEFWYMPGGAHYRIFGGIGAYENELNRAVGFAGGAGFTGNTSDVVGFKVFGAGIGSGVTGGRMEIWGLGI